MNLYLIKTYFYNDKEIEVEIRAESSVLAVRTFLEDFPKKLVNKNIDCIKVNRLT